MNKTVGDLVPPGEPLPEHMMEHGQRDDDTWMRIERYIDWKSSMVVAASYLCVAIRALEQAEFGLAGLKTYPALKDGKLRSELVDHEYRLEEIRDMLIEMQALLRKDARKDFTGQTDGTEASE